MSDDEDLDRQVLEGWFWMPGDDRRAYGRLEHDLRDGPRLHLVGGEFVDHTDSGPVPIWNVSAIHGEALSGKRLSVFDFWTSGWSAPLTLSESTVVDGIADRVLVGEHVARAEDVTANCFVCSIFGLRELIVGTLHQQGVLDIPTGDEEHSRPLTVDLGDGVNLMFTARRHRDGRVVDFRSHVDVTAQFTAWPARSLPDMERDYVQPLQDLIVFATRRQSWVSSLAAIRETRAGSVTSLSAADPPPHETRELVTIALNLREHADPAAVIRAWYDLRRRVGPVWETFFKALSRRQSPPEDQFIPVVSFAEGYHRAIQGECPPLSDDAHHRAVALMREVVPTDLWAVYGAPLNYANSRSQRKRLEDLIGRTLEVMPGWHLNAKVFRDEVIDTRNWLIHWGDKGRNTVEDRVARALLVHRLVVVIYANLAFGLGFDAHAVARVITNGWRELP